MSSSEGIICIDCGNDEGGVDCDLCSSFTCSDCCRVINTQVGTAYICRQCYTKLYPR